MELRVLRYFLAVARAESITGAAQALHVSQPTLSKQLMDLEKRLGQVLLVRGNRKITLTEEGMLLRKRAQEIIDLVDRTEAELNQTDDVISGDIYIGCGETDAMRLIARTAQKLQRSYPDIRYHLYSGNAEDVAERMDKGLLDFGVLIGATDFDKYNYLKLSAVDTWGLLMRKDSRLAAAASIKPKALRDIPIICSQQALACNELSGWLGNHLDSLHVMATYNLIYNAALMVEEDVGYALCLDKLVNTTGKSGLCFVPLEPRIEAHLHIVWKKQQVFSKAAGAFLKTLQELLALPNE